MRQKAKARLVTVRRSFSYSIVSMLLFSTSQSAVPDETEWQAWPEYCRVRFVISGDGVNSRYVNRVSKHEIDAWERKMGDAWYGLHHFCFGLLLSNRAKFAEREQEIGLNRKNALAEFEWSYRRLDGSHFFYPEVSSKVVGAYVAIGEFLAPTSCRQAHRISAKKFGRIHAKGNYS